MRKITFIVHGKYSASDKMITRISEAFDNSFQLDFSFTKAPFDAIELAREVALAGAEYIIGVCGDGTFNEIVNGVMQSGKKEVCVGLLPSGTGNDFSKTMQVTSDPAALRQLIKAGKTCLIDIGLVNYKKGDGTDGQRYFNNITDVGIGGVIAEKIAGSSKMLGAFLTFQWAIVTTFLQFKHQHAKIKADDFLYEGKILSCIVANGKYFGAGLGIAPDAKPGDGLFEVVLGADISLWDYLKNLGNIRKCKKVIHPQMKYLPAKEIFIETSEKRLPIDMDGEFIGYTPMKVNMLPQALKFISPL
jgi:diacylglycerol kinase (ATP)